MRFHALGLKSNEKSVDTVDFVSIYTKFEHGLLKNREEDTGWTREQVMTLLIKNGYWKSGAKFKTRASEWASGIRVRQ